MLLGQLAVVLDLRRLVAGRDLAVDPIGRLQARADLGGFGGGEEIGDLNQHGGTP
ncbi:Uncharacterised protein [Bordetella pertussis]|nr:Uncharacterised protein [Bordetella pertussis]